MTTIENSKANTLPQRYKRYRLDGDQSAASLLLGQSPCGIYIYRFSDDSWYIGQTTNLAARHRQHLHDYRHNSEYESVELTDLYFMEVASERGGEYPDKKEIEAIQWADAKNLHLHNRLITGRPRGEDVAELVLDDGTVFELPWDRSRMTNRMIEPANQSEGAAKALERKASRICSAAFYNDLCSIMGAYIRDTVHEAATGVGKLWSVSALPSTGGVPRVMTFSVSNLETVYVTGSVKGSIECIYVNCKRPEADRRMAPPLIMWHGLPGKAGYKTTADVVIYAFDSLERFETALEDTRFLDWCYRLNIELMRKSPTVHTRGFNPTFAHDLLKAAGLLA